MPHFRDVAEWLPEVILLVGVDGRLHAANRAARRLLGACESALPDSLLTHVRESDRDRVRQFLREAIRTRNPLPVRLHLVGLDGVTSEVRGTGHRVETISAVMQEGTPMRPDPGVAMHLAPVDQQPSQFRLLTERIEALGREIQRRKEVEAERERLQERMLQAQKLESLGVLAGGIAHDFNNLLTSVIGYCDLARLELPTSSAAIAMIDEAVQGARRAAELTQQMLAYAGKARFTKGPLHLSALVTETARLLEVSISKKCVLRYELMPDLPLCTGDPTQLRQVIMNLIINASEAIGDRSGAITISTGAAWCDEAYLRENHVDDGLAEGLYVHLEVADTGSGMTPEVRARIFDPFFTTKFTGRGLGLAAVVGIVRAHQGAVRVYSEPGRGTTFKLLFPAHAPDVVHDHRDADGRTGWRGSGTVLVVDDEESVRALARHMLTQFGFEVVTAADGLEGVARYRELRTQAQAPLVLLDLTMPHLDGEGTFRTLRQLDPHVRVLLMSGYSELSVEGRFAGKGLRGFVQKPFRLEQLREKVRQALDMSV